MPNKHYCIEAALLTGRSFGHSFRDREWKRSVELNEDTLVAIFDATSVRKTISYENICVWTVCVSKECRMHDMVWLGGSTFRANKRFNSHFTHVVLHIIIIGLVSTCMCIGIFVCFDSIFFRSFARVGGHGGEAEEECQNSGHCRAVAVLHWADRKSIWFSFEAISSACRIVNYVKIANW